LISPSRVREPLWLEVAAFIALIIILFHCLMKTLLIRLILISMLPIALLGCATPGPTPEQQARDADQQKEAERQQKEFRKSLPPVANPGQGW
jgi:predicted small lipoprotein YifL